MNTREYHETRALFDAGVPLWVQPDPAVNTMHNVQDMRRVAGVVQVRHGLRWIDVTGNVAVVQLDRVPNP